MIKNSCCRTYPTSRIISTCMGILVLITFNTVNAETPGRERAASKHQVFKPTQLAGQELPFRWYVKQLVSKPGEEEDYRQIEQPGSVGLSVQDQHTQLDESTWLVELQFSYEGDRAIAFLCCGELKTPTPPSMHWNGFINTSKETYDPDDVTLSKWFPMNAAINCVPHCGKPDIRPTGIGLGVHPFDIYSRIESGAIKGEIFTLYLNLPLLLDPGQTRSIRYVVTAFPCRYGYRDAVQKYYDIFPGAYNPLPDVDTRIMNPGTATLAWAPEKMGITHSAGLIRRITAGLGGWEWCYMPFIRGGDWAITDQWSAGWKNEVTGGTYTQSHVDQRRSITRDRFATVHSRNSAVLYYLNFMYAERTLIDEHFPNTVFARREGRSWGQPIVTSVFPGLNPYGELFLTSIDMIFERFPQADGIAWDSAFGHRILEKDIDGVVRSPYRSYRQGHPVCIEGASHARLLDRNHTHIRENGKRMANVLNLKLTTPYFNHARSDAGLYEGAPNNYPSRLDRLECMKVRFGSKAISWHHGLRPRHIGWIEWDLLTPVEIEGAYRQIHHDALLLSYYWGAYPSPYMPMLGIQRWFDAMPELISLVRQGWQASPKVVADGRVLLARYGRSVGSRIVIINPLYESQTITVTLPEDDWQGYSTVVMSCNGSELESVLTGKGTTATLSVPAHDVVVLGVVGALKSSVLRDHEDMIRVVSKQTTGKGGVLQHIFRMETDIADELPFTFAWQENANEATLLYQGKDIPVIKQKPAACTAGSYRGNKRLLDAGAATTNSTTNTIGCGAAAATCEVTVRSNEWPIDYQSMTETLRKGTFYLRYIPSVGAYLDSGQLSKLASEQSTDWKIVVQGEASMAIKTLANALMGWGKADTAGAGRPVFVDDADSPSQVTVRLEKVELKQIHPHSARISLEGNTLVLQACDESAFQKAQVAFLSLLDKAFPFYGHIPGDPYLKKAGLVGKSLKTASPEQVVEPTLEEWLIRAGLFPPRVPEDQ